MRLISISIIIILSILASLLPIAANSAPIGHAPWIGESLEGAPCLGDRENFGPFDYIQRHSLPKELSIVESYHFTPEVEQLIRGHTGASPLGDIDYTLRAWPNHHRALYSAVQFRIKTHNKRPILRYPPAECYLQRAILFSPDDAMPHMLFAIMMQRLDHNEQALKEYEKAINIDPTNPQIAYNLALLLVELKQFDKALTYAKDLYGRGFPLPGLMEKLKAAGHWE